MLVDETVIVPQKYVLKMKKTRRGKKRPGRERGLHNSPTGQRKKGRGCDVEFQGDDQQTHVYSVTAEPVCHCASCDTAKSDKKFVRPRHSPRAPHNSTQFLIEDHLQGGDNFGLSDHHDQELEEGYDQNQAMPAATSPAYSDIDFEYVSPDDMDTSMYMTRDFEETFTDIRQDKLNSQTKEELVANIVSLEERLSVVEAKLADVECEREESSTWVGDFNDFKQFTPKLLDELHCLIDQNMKLKHENALLKSKVTDEGEVR